MLFIFFPFFSLVLSIISCERDSTEGNTSSLLSVYRMDNCQYDFIMYTEANQGENNSEIFISTQISIIKQHDKILLYSYCCSKNPCVRQISINAFDAFSQECNSILNERTISEIGANEKTAPYGGFSSAMFRLKDKKGKDMHISNVYLYYLNEDDYRKRLANLFLSLIKSEKSDSLPKGDYIQLYQLYMDDSNDELNVIPIK